MFQRAPATEAEFEAARPLAIPPEEVAEMDEATWYERAFRGDDAPQLTLRAVGMGSVLGFALAFTNVYIGLKTGWHLGVAITACILSYVIWTAMHTAGLVRTQMTILENNCMQSTASAAGYSTGGTVVSAISALLMLSATVDNPAGEHLSWPVLASWTFFTAVLGVCLAIPMKRNMINRERLKFPSGLAAATTLQSLYASGEEAAKKGKVLLATAGLGAVFPVLVDLNAKVGTDGARSTFLPGLLNVFDFLPAFGRKMKDGQPILENGAPIAVKPSDWNLAWEVNPVMVAAGAIVGLRMTTWMFIGAIVLAYGIGPSGLEAIWTAPNGRVLGAVTAPAKAWRELGLWFGAPILVASGLLSFGLQYKTILRAFSGLFGSAASGDSDRVASVEVPTSWFVGGATVSGAAIAAIAWMEFGVPPHYGVLAVFLTFFLALVACRATGESDITPTGAMGKIMQLTYGVLIPQNATANLMTAGITSSSASCSADLLNDLKSGYLLGAHPRRQFLAQASGILTGTIATTIGFYALVPDATVLNGVGDVAPQFSAPAAQSWRAVAEVFRDGIGNMHPLHQRAILAGLLVGAVITLLETFAPKPWRRWIPSATGFGLGFILPAYNTVSMFAGAVLALAWQRTDAKMADAYTVPAASGIIAGVSIVGVIVAMINNLVLV